MASIALAAAAVAFVLAPYQSAETIMRALPPGGRIVGIQKGQCSLADLALAAADLIGGARVLVHSWGISLEDLVLLQLAASTGRIASLELRMDNRRASGDRFAQARASFGTANVTTSAVHAEIATVEGNGRGIAIRGSLGLYRMPVHQQIDISDSPELCAAIRREHAAPQAAVKFPKAPAEARLAGDVLARLVPGGHVFAVTAGFSVTALVLAALDLTGPADVSIATWSGHVKKIAAVRDHANARSLRLMIGDGFLLQEPKRALATMGALPIEAVRASYTHAKVITIRNERWNLTIRGSMNLCENPRAEQIDIDDSAPIADFFGAWFDETFAALAPGFRRVTPALRKHFKTSLTGGTNDSAYNTTGIEEPAKPLDLTRYAAPAKPLELQPLLPFTF